MNELLDLRLDVIDIERKTRAGYAGKIGKHIRPTIGRPAGWRPGEGGDDRGALRAAPQVP